MAGKQVLVQTGGDLGVAIAEARRARGLTQSEAADLADVSRVYLAKIETGLTVVLLDRALRVLRRLGARVVVELPAEADAGDDER